MTIVNDDSRVINKLEASLADDTKVVIYDHEMFIVQATGGTNVRSQKCPVTLGGLDIIPIVHSTHRGVQ
jgi:hypothetical protein